MTYSTSSTAPRLRPRSASASSETRPVHPAFLSGPPVLGDLSMYLEKLPPMIARKKVTWFTGGAIGPKKLANDDSLGKGPRVRQVVCGAIVYPTEFFLEYLERQGVTTIAPPPL